MKRMISALLVLVFVLSLIGTSAMAAGGFDKSVFENSRKFSRFGFGNWSLIGGYEKSFQGADIGLPLVVLFFRISRYIGISIFR